MKQMNFKWLNNLSCKKDRDSRHKFSNSSCRLSRKSYEIKPETYTEIYLDQIEEQYQGSLGLSIYNKQPEQLHNENSCATNCDPIISETMTSQYNDIESTYYFPSDRKSGPIKNIDEKIYRAEFEYDLGPPPPPKDSCFRSTTTSSSSNNRTTTDVDGTLRKETTGADQIQFADAVSNCDSLGSNSASPPVLFPLGRMMTNNFPAAIPIRPPAEYLEMKAGGDCMEVSRSRSPSSRRPSGGLVLAKSCLPLESSVPKPDSLPDEELVLMATARGVDAPRAEQEDCVSTLEAGSETYEEAWDLRLQRKLNMPLVPAVAEADNNNKEQRLSPPPLIGIRHNPQASAFRPAKPPSLSLQANLALDSAPAPAAPPVPRHHSSLNNNTQSIEPGNLVFLDKPLVENPWYHLGLNRRDAEALLSGTPEGTFLIRPSETKINEYALSISHENTVTHMLIAQNEQGKFVLGRFSSAYESIQAMIGNFLSRDLRVQNSTIIRLKYPYTAVVSQNSNSP